MVPFFSFLYSFLFTLGLLFFWPFCLGRKSIFLIFTKHGVQRQATGQARRELAD